jgi:mannose-6-phosphate isomerase-like protein (cupin superfamily)
VYAGGEALRSRVYRLLLRVPARGGGEVNPGEEVTMEPVNLKEKLALFDSHWDPKIVGELNGQHVKLVKFQGDFVWHAHDHEDELFLVLEGTFEMQYRARSVSVSEGEFVIVPRGVEHCPRASEEVHVLLFEPVSTVNTGDAPGSRTVARPETL